MTRTLHFARLQARPEIVQQIIHQLFNDVETGLRRTLIRQDTQERPKRELQKIGRLNDSRNFKKDLNEATGEIEKLSYCRWNPDKLG